MSVRDRARVNSFFDFAETKKNGAASKPTAPFLTNDRD
jgi:hypothetical protein